MGINEWIVVWTTRHDRSPGRIKIARLGDDIYWSKEFSMVDGCCWVGWHHLKPVDKVARLLFTMMNCIADGVDVQDAHREFMRIKEYRNYHWRSRVMLTRDNAVNLDRPEEIVWPSL
jgi:hypothetical protein